MKLKKIVLCVLSISLLSSSVFASSNIPVYVKGKLIDTSSAPAYISNTSKTMIPVRTVGEILGLKVDWQTPYVTLSGPHLQTNKTITVKLNSKTGIVTINGSILTHAIEIKKSRSYITLRVLAEAFGYKVDWKNKSVYIELPTSSPLPPVTTPSVPAEDKGINEKVLALVNKERAKHGLANLSLDASLCKVALAKSNDMFTNQYFSHTSPTYGSPFDMLKQFGISYTAAGENIAKGYATPEAVVEGWMNSEGHRANILNGSYTHMGIGYVANGNYWTQLFIKK